MHLFIEASKLAYADRNLYIADSDFVAVPSQGLMDKAYLKERFTKFLELLLKRRNRELRLALRSYCVNCIAIKRVLGLRTFQWWIVMAIRSH